MYSGTTLNSMTKGKDFKIFNLIRIGINPTKATNTATSMEVLLRPYLLILKELNNINKEPTTNNISAGKVLFITGIFNLR